MSSLGAQAQVAEGRDPYVGNALCLRCHEQMLLGLEPSPHGGDAFDSLFERGCQSCHGPGRAHVQDPDNESQRPRVAKWNVNESIGLCTSCHDIGDHGSGHAANGVACSDCHDFHDWESGIVPGSDVRPRCQTCHAADGEWRFEGPHGESSDLACTECHELMGAAEMAAAPRTGTGPSAEPTSDDRDPYVGSEMCSACHEDLVQSLEPSPHGGETLEAVFEHGCQTCHGPGRAHVRNPDDPAHQPRIGNGAVASQNQVCQECHGESSHGAGHAAQDVSCSGCHSVHDWDAGVSGAAGQEACSTCHAAKEEWHFAGTPHAGADVACLDCHDLEGEGPLPSGAEGSRFCLECHAETHPRFGASPHAVIGCSDCHQVHGREDRPAGGSLFDIATITGASAKCSQCHEDIAAVFQLNERHRLQEGILECTSCHDPHAPSQRLRLGGFKQQECLACHADKGGPWVFEHGAQRVEGCVACHDPHGSPNRHLLHFQRVSDLCYSCHADVPGFHVSMDPNRNCLECHFAMHGSNVDPSFFQ